MLATNTSNKPSKKGKERMKALARKHDPNHVPKPNYKTTKAEPDTPATKAAQDNKPSSNNSSNNQQATQPQKSGNKRKSKQRENNRVKQQQKSFDTVQMQHNEPTYKKSPSL